MTQRKTIVRKVTPERQATFDEQLWPSFAVLCVLSAFLMGLAAALLRFDHPVWYKNAVTWLAAIPLITAATFVVLLKVESKVLRRGAMLALMLSLLINTWLVCLLGLVPIFFPIEVAQEVVAEPTEQPEIITVPEHALWKPDGEDEPHDFQKTPD